MIDFLTSDDLRQMLVNYGYIAILLVVAVEAMGIPVPGETMLILASVYAGTTHHLEIGLVIVAAAAGAILGDNLGFLAGQYGGYRLVHRYGRYVRLDERKLRVGERLFERHGGKVVFFGRFLPILRVWAAFLAGTHRMGWYRFLGFNAAGGVVWATSIGLAGYLFGASLLRSGGMVSVVSVLAAVLVAAIVALTVRRRDRRLQEGAKSDAGERNAA
jgi:membrane protein DedA with SNARE-associated domain